MPILLTPFTEREVEIPEWVTSNTSFLRWARSKDAPEKGKYGFLQDRLWVDYSMETLFHNFIKAAIYAALGNWVIEQELGDLLPDGMMLTVPSQEFTTQPDGMFVSFASWNNKRVMLKKEELSVVVTGSPDMVLEVVSPTTYRKDHKVLHQLYWKAKIKEYWLVDNNEGEPVLTILKRGSRGYVAVPAQDGWLHSTVFGADMQLVSTTVAGKKRYRLKIQGA